MWYKTISGILFRYPVLVYCKISFCKITQMHQGHWPPPRSVSSDTFVEASNTVCPKKCYLYWPVEFVFGLFMFFMFFYMTYNLCFNDSPCYTAGYFNYKSICMSLILIYCYSHHLTWKTISTKVVISYFLNMDSYIPF